MAIVTLWYTFLDMLAVKSPAARAELQLLSDQTVTFRMMWFNILIGLSSDIGMYSIFSQDHSYFNSPHRALFTSGLIGIVLLAQATANRIQRWRIADQLKNPLAHTEILIQANESAPAYTPPVFLDVVFGETRADRFEKTTPIEPSEVLERVTYN